MAKLMTTVGIEINGHNMLAHLYSDMSALTDCSPSIIGKHAMYPKAEVESGKFVRVGEHIWTIGNATFNSYD